MEPLMGPKKRIFWLDLAQILSMIFVCFHHSIPKGYTADVVTTTIAGGIHYPALAIFIFISGYFAYDWTRKGYVAYIKKRFFRLVVPWVGISIIMIFPKVIMSKIQGAGMNLSGIVLLKALIDPHGSGVLPHLWFLPTLMILTLLLPLFEVLRKNKSSEIFTLLAFAIISCIPTSITTVMCLDELRMYTFYYVLGYYIHSQNMLETLENRCNLKFTTIGLVVFGLIFALILFTGKKLAFYRFILTVFGFIAIALFGIVFEGYSTKLIIWLRPMIFTVYLLSLCFQNFIEVLAPHITDNYYIVLITMFLTGLLIPVIIYKIVELLEKKIKIHPLLKAIIGM